LSIEDKAAAQKWSEQFTGGKRTTLLSSTDLEREIIRLQLRGHIEDREHIAIRQLAATNPSHALTILRNCADLLQHPPAHMQRYLKGALRTGADHPISNDQEDQP
jgi:hypothetical protein